MPSALARGADDLPELHWLLQASDVREIVRDDILIVAGDEHERDILTLKLPRQIKRDRH